MRSGWVMVGGVAVGAVAGCMGSRTPADGGSDGIAFIANAEAGAPDGGVDAGANVDADADAAGGSDASLVYPAVPGTTVLSFVVPNAADVCATRTRDGWCWVAPRPQGMRLRDASSPRLGELWAVGDSATVLHGHAGGWELVDLGVFSDLVFSDLSAVYAAADGSVWIGSLAGEVIRGVDGAGWTVLQGRGIPPVAALWAAGRDDAWAVGDNGTVRRWTGGAWSDVDLGSDRAAAIVGRAADDVWLATFTGGWRHWDGASWTSGEISPTPSAAFTFNSMGVLDDGTVWASERSSDLETTTAYMLVTGTSLWLPTHGHTLAGAGIADYWASVGSRVDRIADGIRYNLPDVSAPAEAKLVGGAGDFWAVGSGPEIRHWTARAGWDARTTALATTTHARVLGPDDVWATGADGLGRTSVQHWDGGAWRSFVLPGSASIGRIAAGASDTVWLAGESLWHADRQVLQEYPFPRALTDDAPMRAITLGATPGGTVWVLGDVSRDSAVMAFVLLRFDGLHWHREALPSGLDARDSAPAMGAAGEHDLWLVQRARVVHRGDADWSSWTMLSDAAPVSFAIDDVLARAPDDVWAGPYHFDGTTWTMTASLGEVGTVSSLWAAAADDMWMASESTGLRHWNGRAWSGALATPTRVFEVTGAGADLWIVGGEGLLHGTPPGR